MQQARNSFFFLNSLHTDLLLQNKYKNQILVTDVFALKVNRDIARASKRHGISIQFNFICSHLSHNTNRWCTIAKYIDKNTLRTFRQVLYV